MLEKFHGPIEDLVPVILKSLFDATIGLISEDFNSYPDHRVNFFEFLRSGVQFHLRALFSMP
jgi:exportin-1